LLVHSFCFFPFAKEITLFAFCLLFFCSFHASIDFQFPYLSSFPLLLQQLPHLTMFPYDNPHVACAVCIIIFSICCQCSFTSTYFQSGSTTLSLTVLWYSSHVFTSLSFHTRTLGSNFLCHLFVVLNRMSITYNLCFGTHSSFGMTLTV